MEKGGKEQKKRQKTHQKDTATERMKTMIKDIHMPSKNVMRIYIPL